MILEAISMTIVILILAIIISALIAGKLAKPTDPGNDFYIVFGVLLLGSFTVMMNMWI